MSVIDQESRGNKREPFYGWFLGPKPPNCSFKSSPCFISSHPTAKNAKENQRAISREKDPIKRETSIFGWIDQVRVKYDRLLGDSDCLNVRRSRGNCARGVRKTESNRTYRL